MIGTEITTVIGGSGFVGRYVVQKLADRGHRVRVVCRRPHSALYLKPLGRVGQIQLLQGNLRNRASIERALDGATGVINLVGILAERGRQTFQALQAEAPGAIGELARAAGARAFVQMSAIGADPQSQSAYGRSKAAGEVAARKAFADATIIRPSIIFGPEDDFFNRFARLAKMLPVMPVVAGHTRFQPVHVVNVADAIACAVAEPRRFQGGTYELGGPEVASFADIIRFIMETIMVERPMVEMPMAVARLQAALTGWLPGAPLTSDQLRMLERDNVVAPGVKTLADFGIAPTSFRVVTPSYLVVHRPQGEFSRAERAMSETQPGQQ